MHLILYSKPGCHLCEGLQEKIEQIQQIPIQLEVRDITSKPEWFQVFQYEIPVLYRVNESEGSSVRLPRISPRATVLQVEQMLQKYDAFGAK
jgi:Glutaredoxin-like domain (DUF836)